MLNEDEAEPPAAAPIPLGVLRTRQHKQSALVERSGSGTKDFTSRETSSCPYSCRMTSETAKLRAIGFCGVDDSVHPHLLGVLCQSYPLVEFGVLFRPDKEGAPRYASPSWVKRLSAVALASGGKMRLAAHLCGSRVNEVLDGNDQFLSGLRNIGFQRVQINATAVNGVDTSNLANSVTTFAEIVSNHPELEFILQKNEETRPLWEGMLNSDCSPKGSLPVNVSMLVDESKGTGVLASSWPSPPKEYKIGYAGGIGPHNVKQVLQDVKLAAKGSEVWIDMESSLRSTKNGKDVFDIDKCYSVIAATCEASLCQQPPFLPGGQN